MKAAWTLRLVRRHVGLHRWTVVAALASFFLLALVAGISHLGARTVARWGSFVGQNVHVIAYLGDEMNEDAQGLAEILRRVPNVAQVTVVEPAQAFAHFKASAASFGADAKSLETLEPTYFPRSLEIRLAPGLDLAARAEDFANHLRAVPGVAQVDAMGGGLARLSAWTGFGKKLGIGVLIAQAVLALAALVAVFVRIRAALARRSAVLVQLGESASGIRLPAGMWMAAAAAIGGGVGAAVLSLLWRPMVARLERGLGMLATPPLPSLGPVEITAGLATIVALGMLLGYFATPVAASDGHA